MTVSVHPAVAADITHTLFSPVPRSGCTLAECRLEEGGATVAGS